jgi:lipoate-protein ligase B
VRTTEARWLGRVSYAEALALQEEAREALRGGVGSEQLLLLEHPPVYTLGRNARPADVLASPEWLAARGISIFETDRGGQVTYHGPGQLVGYPILDLNPDRRDIRRYVRDLQEVLVRTLSGFGIRAQPGEGAEAIGVWVDGAKIASIGVHVRRWITTHGFALNVTTDLDSFAGIVACGLPQVRMTSIARLLGRPVDVGAVAEALVGPFSSVFGRAVEPLAVAS